MSELKYDWTSDNGELADHDDLVTCPFCKQEVFTYSYKDGVRGLVLFGHNDGSGSTCNDGSRLVMNSYRPVTMEQCQSRLDRLLALLEQP